MKNLSVDRTSRGDTSAFVPWRPSPHPRRLFVQCVALFRFNPRMVPAMWGLLVSGLLTATAQPQLQPLRAGRFEATGAYGVAAAGNYAYVAVLTTGLQVICVTNPATPVRVGGYDTSGYAKGVALAGNYACVADLPAGLQVIDVTNPTNCIPVGGYNANGAVSSVAVAGNYAYVTTVPWWTGSNIFGGAGLEVIDISDPTNCVPLGGCSTTFGGESLAVAGNYAYLAVGRGGLQVIDVTNPTNCVEVGSCDTGGAATGVALAGNYAYVTIEPWFTGSNYFGGTGLRVIDVSQPTNCVILGGYNFGMGGKRVAVAGNYAYVAANDDFAVIDVNNPTDPKRVGGYDTGPGAGGVAVLNDRIYVANENLGLWVLASVANVQFTVRVEANTNIPFTVEAATNLVQPISWTPLLTTNVTAMPFDFVDFDVRVLKYPQKYYRVRQP